jgi:hypothetical protein
VDADWHNWLRLKALRPQAFVPALPPLFAHSGRCILCFRLFQNASRALPFRQSPRTGAGLHEGHPHTDWGSLIVSQCPAKRAYKPHAQGLELQAG